MYVDPTKNLACGVLFSSWTRRGKVCDVETCDDKTVLF